MPVSASIVVVPRDEDLIEELYSEYERRIYRYIAARVGSSAEAEDLASQTYLKAIETLQRGYIAQNSAAWLFGIARHIVADHYRSRRKVSSLDDAEGIAAPEHRLDEAIATQFQLERVADALASLAPDRAEALALRIFGDLSSAEVAEVMGKSPGAVKLLIYRAIQDLRSRLSYMEEY
jgi:RNA polymerase sigma-70 factor, ECF subfamily